MTPAGSDPWQLVEQLRDWGEATAWCDWIELGGSLGRGQGDAWSDVDAGIGVAPDGTPFAERRDAALEAVRAFAPVADDVIQHLGSPAQPVDHLIVQYADGRQLSLVVMSAELRQGLPLEARAVLDRSGRLSRPLDASNHLPGPGELRKWAFLAWVGLGDAHKHALRGRPWRAIRSLAEAREVAWRLHAASLGVTYPAFGEVSVENAGLPAPAGLERTLPTAPEAAAIMACARQLAPLLDELTAPHCVDGIARIVRAQLAATPDPHP
jgi:hypothetical protein